MIIDEVALDYFSRFQRGHSKSEESELAQGQIIFLGMVVVLSIFAAFNLSLQ